MKDEERLAELEILTQRIAGLRSELAAKEEALSDTSVEMAPEECRSILGEIELLAAAIEETGLAARDTHDGLSPAAVALPEADRMEDIFTRAASLVTPVRVMVAEGKATLAAGVGDPNPAS